MMRIVVAGNEYGVPFFQSSSSCLFSGINNAPFNRSADETCLVYVLAAMVHATTGLFMKLRSGDGHEEDRKSLARHQIQS